MLRIVRILRIIVDFYGFLHIIADFYGFLQIFIWTMGA